MYENAIQPCTCSVDRESTEEHKPTDGNQTSNRYGNPCALSTVTSFFLRHRYWSFYIPLRLQLWYIFECLLAILVSFTTNLYKKFETTNVNYILKLINLLFFLYWITISVFMSNVLHVTERKQIVAGNEICISRYYSTMTWPRYFQYVF